MIHQVFHIRRLVKVSVLGNRIEHEELNMDMQCHDDMNGCGKAGVKPMVHLTLRHPMNDGSVVRSDKLDHSRGGIHLPDAVIVESERSFMHNGS